MQEKEGEEEMERKKDKEGLRVKDRKKTIGKE